MQGIHQPSLARKRSVLLGVLLAAFLFPLQLLATNTTPLSYFFAFYDQNLMEFSTAATMTINGLVHGNTNIYVGTDAHLTFNNPVSTAGTVSAPANNGGSWGNPTNYSSSWNTSFNGSPGFVNNSSIIETSLGANNAHLLIDLPPNGEDPNSFPGSARLYNQAQVILTVTNSGANGTNVAVTVTVQRSPGDGQVPGADPSPVVVTYSNLLALFNTNLTFLRMTNRFYDRREGVTNLTTQIDIGLYKTWLTNALGPVYQKYFNVFGDTNFPTILYVADNRTVGPNQRAVVRLTNGFALPSNGGLGFSIATPNPLYVWGNFNCTNPAYLGTTNTSSSEFSALYCDALTILSSSWSDANSLQSIFSSGSVSWEASPTTINSAILAGIVPSTGTDSVHFSGGIHNFPRLLEDWSSTILVMNTAFINLYNSTRATNRFKNPGTYYNPPTRKFSHDPRYNNPAIAPPGMPMALVGAPLIYTRSQTVIEPYGSNDLVITVSAGSPAYHPLAPQLAYQWAVSGTNIDSATNSFLALSNLQASESNADYTVTVTDGISTNTATILHLVVMNVPPVITQQPADQSVLIGSNAMFFVTAVGQLPMTWQWQFNQTNIDDATNATLVLTNVTPDQAGAYSVFITNANGGTLSSNANLFVYLSPMPAMVSPVLTIDNQMQFTITGVPGLNYAVQVSTDLMNWDFVATNAAPFDFTDTNTANFPARYYRTVYLP